MTGGVLQMVNHGLSTGALFLLVGMVYERTHTRDLGKMGGLADRDAVAHRRLPVRGRSPPWACRGSTTSSASSW